MFVVIYLTGFLHYVEQLQNSQQVMFNPLTLIIQFEFSPN